MANVSADIYDEAKRYVQLILQQNVPIVDADVNDGQQIDYRSLFRRLLQDVVGNGAREDAFKVAELPPGPAQDFIVIGGTHPDGGALRFWAEGHKCQLYADENYMNAGPDSEVQPWSTDLNNEILTDENHKHIPGSLVGKVLEPNVEDGTGYTIVANTEYTITVTPGSTMTSVASVGNRYRVRPTTPVGSDRTDYVYLDVWLREIGSAQDPDLEHVIEGIPFEAMRRYKVIQTVRLDEGTGGVPAAYTDAAGHVHVIVPLAQIDRIDSDPTITDAMITDLRLHLFRTNEVDDRYVNKTGDSMQGDLSFDASTHITGDDVIDDPEVLADDLVDQTRLDRNTHLLGINQLGEDVVPVTRPDVHDNRYYTKPYIDQKWGQNLMVNPDFKDGWHGWTNEYPFVIDGWPLAEALDDIRLGRKLCCDGGIQIDIDPCCHACEVLFISQDYEFLCNACVDEVFLYETISIPKMLEGDQVRPYMRVDFWNQDQYLGYEIEVFGPYDESVAHINLEAVVPVPKAATKLTYSLGCFLDTVGPCVGGDGITIIIHHAQVRSIQPIQFQDDECCVCKNQEPIIRDVTNQGVIEYEHAANEKIIEIWKAPFQKWVWDPIPEKTYRPEKIVEQPSSSGVTTGGVITPSSPAVEFEFILDTSDPYEGPKDATFRLHTQARYMSMEENAGALIDLTTMIDLGLAVSNIPSDITKIRIILEDTASRNKTYEQPGVVPASGWKFLQFWNLVGTDAGFDITQVTKFKVEIFGSPVTLLEIGDFRVDYLVWFEAGVPLIPPVTLDLANPCTDLKAMYAELNGCTSCTFFSILPPLDAPMNALGGATHMRMDIRNMVEIPPGALIIMRLFDGIGGCAEYPYIVPGPIPEKLPGDACTTLLFPIAGFTDPCPAWAPLAWDNVVGAELDFSGIAPTSSQPDPKLWIDSIWSADGAGNPLGVQPLFETFEPYIDSLQLQAHWICTCTAGVVSNVRWDFNAIVDTAQLNTDFAAEAYTICPPSDQAHVTGDAYEGLQAVFLDCNSTGKFFNAEWFGAPKNLVGLPADVSFWTKSNPASWEAKLFLWDILGNIAVVSGPGSTNVTVPSSAAWQKVTFTEITAPAFDWTQVTMAALKVDAISERPVQIFLDKFAINGEALVFEDFEAYVGDGDLWGTWYTNICGAIAPTGLPIFNVAEPMEECTSPIVVWPAWDGRDIRYYGDEGYWGAEILLVPGRYQDTDPLDPLTYVHMIGQQDVDIAVGSSYVFQESGPKIEVFCDGDWSTGPLVHQYGAQVRVEVDGIETFNGQIDGGFVNPIPAPGYGPAEIFTILPNVGPPATWPIPYDTINFDMGPFGGTTVRYGYATYLDEPDPSCRNIFIEPVYALESHQIGLEPVATTYTFYDHPCECRQIVEVLGFGEPVYDDLFYKVLPDDGFEGMPQDFGETLKLKYFDDGLADFKWMGTQITPDQVKFSGGGREDADFGVETEYITIWMGPGSAEVVGNHSRESLLSVDANLAGVLVHTFTVDPTEIAKWGVGMKVWIRNSCMAGACKIKCCDVMEESKQPSPDANIAGAYGEITDVFPGTYQVEVTFADPVTALFETSKKAEIIVSPYESTFKGAMGFYWEMSNDLVTLINSQADPYVRWWFNYWEGEEAECEPEIEGAVFIDDGDGITHEFLLRDSQKRELNPMDWWPLWCGPAFSEALISDALPGNDWIEICDADSWAVGQLVWLFDDSTRQGFLSVILELDAILNRVRLKAAVPSEIWGYPAFTGFFVANNARLMDATVLAHYCLNPTEVQNTDGTPKDGPKYVTIYNDLGLFIFDPTIDIVEWPNVVIYYTSYVNRIQLPPDPGIYRLAAVRSPCGRTKLSQDVKVL
jgi:hypothetical protein